MGYRKEGATTSLAEFSRFCNDKFHLPLKAQRLTDFRKRPVIPMATLFLFLVGSLALRKRSFHQIDLFARQKEVRDWLGSDRYMVASDATFWRVLPRMDRREVREILQQAYVFLRREGHGRLTLPGGRPIRAAAVDGSGLGGRYASAVEILGAHAAVIDLEPTEGRGKELVASERVLRRVFERHGKGFVDVILGDGLYITEKMLRLCREDLKTHLLVKTTELDTLSILQDAEALFRAEGEFARDVEHAKGTDMERSMEYEVWAAPGFHHGKFAPELKVARVRIQMLKGPRKGGLETFWIITTDVSLTAEQMRELAHLRWSIENDVFRSLSAAVDSKRVWTRGGMAAEKFEVLMLAMFLAFTLTVAYHAGLDAGKLWESYRLRSLTLGYLVECWLLSLGTAAGAFFVDT